LLACLTLAALAGLVVLAACGDDDDNGDGTPGVTAEVTPLEDGEGEPTDVVETPEPQGTAPGGPPEATEGPGATSTPPPDAASGAAIEATEAYFIAIRDDDRNLIANSLGSRAATEVEDGEIDELVGCIPGGATVEITSISSDTINKDVMKVNIEFSVEDDRGQRQFGRIWELEQQNDGSWYLYRLPTCPYV
jgi:hypothetical protein